VNSIVSGLTHLSGWVAYAVIGALVFGETAIFLGFVLPGETAAVLGGVLASRGHLSLATLTVVVVVSAVTGPLVGSRSAGVRAIACSRPGPCAAFPAGRSRPGPSCATGAVSPSCSAGSSPSCAR
jgi:hypothetical protein